MASGSIVAEALASDSKAVLDKGVLQVVDNLVDQTTGTVRLKAEFPKCTTAALARPVRQYPPSR